MDPKPAFGGAVTGRSGIERGDFFSDLLIFGQNLYFPLTDADLKPTHGDTLPEHKDGKLSEQDEVALEVVKNVVPAGDVGVSFDNLLSDRAFCAIAELCFVFRLFLDAPENSDVISE